VKETTGLDPCENHLTDTFNAKK